jgi:hypothetical protein
VSRPSYLLFILLKPSYPGSRRRTQKEQKALCPQVHRQAPLHQTEECYQCHPGKAITRRGAA